MPAHFEIHVSDMERAKQFYGDVMGWSFMPMSDGGGDEMEYHLVSGDGVGEDHEITGGLMRRMGDAPSAGSPIRGCTLTFEVADVDATYARALNVGGAEALPPTDYPGIGRAAYCEDGQGNVFGIITSAGES